MTKAMIPMDMAVDLELIARQTRLRPCPPAARRDCDSFINTRKLGQARGPRTCTDVPEGWTVMLATSRSGSDIL